MAQLCFQLAECLEIPRKIRTETDKNFADKLYKLDDQKLSQKFFDVEDFRLTSPQLQASGCHELVEHFKTIGKKHTKACFEKFSRA